MKQSNTALGAGALLSAAFIYAMFGLFTRHAVTMFGDYTQVALRFALAAVILFGVLLVLKRQRRLTRRQALWSVGLGVVFTFVVILFTVAVLRTTIAGSVFWLYAGSIISSLGIGTIFLKEKMTVSKMAAIIVACIGLMVYAGSFWVLSVGLVAAFGSGLFDGAGNAIRKVLGGADRIAVALYANITAAVGASVVVLVAGERLVHAVSITPVITLLVYSLLMVGLGNLLLYGFQHFDVNVGTIILATELLFATVFAFIFAHESPALHQLVGGLLIFVASALTVVDVRTLRSRLKRPGI